MAKYSFNFKLHGVELYLTTEVSYQDLALKVGINNPPLITKLEGCGYTNSCILYDTKRAI